MDGQDISTDINLQADFKAANLATQPLDMKQAVAITPSQGMHGGRMKATPENAEYLRKLNA
jgi:hypothetical protein